MDSGDRGGVDELNKVTDPYLDDTIKVNAMTEEDDEVTVLQEKK
jgi:hypothetical protein